MLLEELRPRKIDVAHKIVHIMGHMIDVGNEILEEHYGKLRNVGSIREINTFVYEDLMLTYNVNLGWPEVQTNTTYQDEVDKSKLVGRLLNNVCVRTLDKELHTMGWEVVQHQVFEPAPADRQSFTDPTRQWISRPTLQLWIKESVPSMEKKDYDRLHDAVRKMAEYEFPDNGY